MGFKCGIVGLPNVGKSTIFNALTQANIDAANYPFCTIEPNIGAVAVPDPRLDQIATLAQSKQVIPTTMRFVDIAGLVEGAAQGEGLGNKFLAHIRETQAIAHVVRCFINEDVTHVAGRVNPIDDIETIHTELALADLECIEKAQAKNDKDVKRGDKTAIKKQALLKEVSQVLAEGQSIRQLNLDEDQLKILQPYQLITLKPVLYIANVNEDGFDNNPLLDVVEEYAHQEGAGMVTLCAAIEAEIAELDPHEQHDFLQSLGLKETGLNRVICAGYDLLGLQTYFTAGPKEARAWTIKQKATAPQAAGVIHTDFETGFIRAEVIGFNDYIEHKGEAGAKEAGRWRLEGKDYIVNDGDVVLFRFNV